MSALSLHNPGSVVVPEDELGDLEAKVLQFLSDHRYNNYYWTMKDISGGVDLYEKGSCPTIRAALRRLNMKGYPIVITGEGAKLAETREELFAYREALWQRAEKIIARAHALTNIVHTQFKQR